MFNLQGSEIIFILLLALVVLGPEKLPSAIRRFTQTYGELRKMGSGFQSELKSALDEPMREMKETAGLIRDQADPSKIAAAADSAVASERDAERDLEARREHEAGRAADMTSAPSPVTEGDDAATDGDDDATAAPSADPAAVTDEWADPIDTAPGDTAPVDTAIADAEPIDTAPAETDSADTAPGEAASAERATPDDADIVDEGPVQESA